MPEDIFEESKIAIQATLKEDGFFSGSYSGKLDLIYPLVSKLAGNRLGLN